MLSIDHLSALFTLQFAMIISVTSKIEGTFQKLI